MREVIENSLPDYFIRFNELYHTRQGYTVKNYLPDLSRNDWKHLLLDLIDDSDYPHLMVTDNMEYSHQTYYASLFSGLNTYEQAIVSEIFVNILKEILKEPGPHTWDRVVEAVKIARIWKQALPSQLLIDGVLKNEHVPDFVRYKAAVTLSSHSTLEAMYFWKYTSLALLSGNAYLSFPRFHFFRSIEPLESVRSLEYFTPFPDMEIRQLQLPLTRFYTNHIDNPVVQVETQRIFRKLNTLLQQLLLKTFDAPIFSNVRPVYKKLYELRTETLAIDEIAEELDSFNQEILADAAIWNLMPAQIDQIKRMAETINPYYPFKKKQLEDFGSRSKEEILTLITEGNRCYKKSEFLPAFEKYSLAVGCIRELPKTNLNVYYYSWVLHQLGNLYSVTGNYEEALSVYTSSYHIKEIIEDLPRPFIFTTQLRILGIKADLAEPAGHWAENLQLLIRKLEIHGEQDRENPLFIRNMLGDAHYYLSRGHYKTKNVTQFVKHFDVGLELAKKNKDTSLIIRFYLLHAAATGNNQYIKKLNFLLEQLQQSEKSDPYITTAFSPHNWINPLPDLFDKIKGVFKRARIRDLSFNPVGQITETNIEIDKKK